ncbi:MAG: N-acetylglucosamine-6-phosphate deacetylase [Lachnospiraceae bacterium]|nr:N-acetylglucosamine-6-phosphate deacetylase [Lachnospiraceae bacterium]
MLVHNAIAFLDDNKFHRTNIRIEAGIITKIAESSDGQTLADEEIYDASGCYALPGLCDIHTHGAVGYDFSDGDSEGLKRIAEYERKVGVTSFLPTSMSLSKAELLRVFEAGRQTQREIISERKQGDKACRYADICGFNMEGPFINPERKGAQKAENIIPCDMELFKTCFYNSGSMIKLLTFAPEIEGASEFIEEMQKAYSGVKLSIGHTNADYERAADAIRAGCKHITHLCNAMPPFHHRDTGVTGAAYDDENVFVELIADGIHVSDSAIRMAFKLFKGRIALISDSMRATGLSDGEYTLGGQKVRVKGNSARLIDGTLAGSVTNLYDCMRYTIKIGIKPEEAIAAASITPARSVGIDDKVGSIAPGKRADILIADEDFKLLKVI